MWSLRGSFDSGGPIRSGRRFFLQVLPSRGVSAPGLAIAEAMTASEAGSEGLVKSSLLCNHCPLVLAPT